MSEVIDAIFEGGVFRPLGRIELADGERVRLSVQHENQLTPDEMLELAARVYDGFSEEEVQEVEGIALDRCRFFMSRDAVLEDWTAASR